MQANCTWRDCIAFTIHLSLKTSILEKAFYFLLLHMFTQYLLLLLLQAVLYYFKKSSLSSGNYVCCLYSHLHQALVNIETCSISQTKWHRTESTYIQTIISEKRTGQPRLMVPIFPDHFDLENKFSPCCKGFWDRNNCNLFPVHLYLHH